MTEKILTVSQVNTYIKSILETDGNIKYIFVSGEIYDFRGPYKSGHVYFTLKDSQSQIDAVMFSGYFNALRFVPENGMRVIVAAGVKVYEAKGQYQLNVRSMQPDGVGSLAVAYEQLKRRLTAQGVFDERRKRPIPVLPRRIGVITSPTGAVIEDIKNVVSRRCPLTEIRLFPALVQGEGSAEQLAKGVRVFNEMKDVDVIIIGRGGGSFEELNSFNNENLIWAIYDSSIPIISAVGHETDFTLCDFAADLRAPTPSAAAELAVPDRAEMMKNMDALLSRIRSLIKNKMHVAFQDIDRLKDSLEALHPGRYIENELLSLELLETRINSAAQSRLTLEHAYITAMANSVNALSPISLLQKGYCAASKDGKGVVSVTALNKGDNVKIRFADGSADCTVNKIVKIGG